ncbi:hypothetical protein K474DRAFT_1587259 [Panus rudis PR-1116 ss-1]|nr:hypothetical protein K474DRAFT_1587259 [Panus rudis PR-1116 ss-1]
MHQPPHPHQQPPPQTAMQHPPPNSYYPDNNTDLTGGLPINLDSLRDGPPGSKPFYPYSTLIRYAIKGSPNQKLLLEDIYYAIESRFPYFRTAPPGWKNSVRHNLSLNPCFEKVPRPLTDRGKGSYWTVNDNVDPRTGVHRVRKKKKGSKNSNDIDYHADPVQYDPNTTFSQPQPMDPNAPGPSRGPTYPAPYPSFDPTFSMMPPPPAPDGMRFGPPMGLFAPDEALPADEHGNINWHAAWRKELSGLQQITEEQEKAGADQEWFRIMLFRVRGAMMAPMNPADPGVVHGVPGGPPPPPPPHHGMPPPQPNPAEVQD